MTFQQLIERRFYIKRAVAFKLFRLPGVWRLLGERFIPKAKGVHGAMLPFHDAVSEATAFFDPDLGEEERKKLNRDMIRAWYKNTVTPEEYYIFGYRDLSQKERDRFVSRKEKDLMMCLHVGIGEDYLLLKDKYKFFSKFGEFFHRDVCLLNGDAEHQRSFFQFCRKHSRFIAKKNKGRMGLGTVVREHDGSDAAIQNEIQYLLSSGEEWVIEELINQDDRMARLNPSSVNSVRVCSRWNRDGFSVFEAFVRMGRAGAVVDNVSSGGLAAAIDIRTGIVSSEGFGKGDRFYPRHPDTMVPLVGFQIPDWDKLMDTVKRIHSLIPRYPYVGWDFALSENGWVVIEGNWGFFLSQYLKIGMKEELKKCFL